MSLLQKAKEMKFDLDACQSLGIQGQAARQADQAAQQFLRIAESQNFKINQAPASPEQIQKAILVGFIDRLAVRLDAGTLRCAVIHHRLGELRRESMVRSAKLLIASEIDEIQTKGEVITYLNLATAIKPEWLNDYFPNEFSDKKLVKYDPTQRRVVTRVERVFRDLVLEAQEQEGVPSDEASQLIVTELLAGRLELEKWDHAVDAWINRINFLAKHCPDLNISVFDESGKKVVLEQICQGATSYREIRDRSVMPILREWLTHEQLLALDIYCPEKIILPRKKHPAKIEYTADGEAIIEATVQELYDVAGSKLRICQGKVPLVICIQSPARRTQQRTTDLDAFWKGSYELVKKELKGRYPKHEWR
jgi:ATP-dependent helicase HrpB